MRHMISQLLDRIKKYIDPFLMGCIAFSCIVGLFVLYSASGGSFERVMSQVFNIFVALIIMWLAANTSPHYLERIALPLFVFGLLLLLGVALFGDISHGARRWLNLGVGKIQPSELMKIAVPMMLAWYFSKREQSLRWIDYAVATLLLLVPVGLIMKQPDLGTALIVTAAGFYVLFLAGLSWKILMGGALSVAVMAPIFWSMLHDYQRKRIEILFDPFQDPLGAGYHTIQASIALGSGGFAGKGWMEGTQSQLDFLPERTTDFIFAVFGEEFGFLGNVLLLILFMLLIGRGLVISSKAQNTFTRLLAGSITLTFFTYVFVNIGMVSGILPVVGVPLPFISYGGTSLVTILLGFGILMSIHTHKTLMSTS
jgi:rod shape determining protein RodA